MPKMLVHVIAETGGDQLRMKDGWELVQVLGVAKVAGSERQWSLVVSKDIDEDGDDA